MSELVAGSWTSRLRALTPARVALGRTGVSQSVRDQLEFQRAHAQARDAVHARLEVGALAGALASFAGEAVCLHSLASDRAMYLQRPDLGRRLDEASRATLAVWSTGRFDLSIVVADGLSALAVERHVASLLRELLTQLDGWSIAPICIVEQGRVAIGDEIGSVLGAQLCLVLIGERPGLSSPDSLGAYVTWSPRPGRTDAERNCVSNIRSEGLRYGQAAAQILFYLREGRRRQLTGVALKDDARLIGNL
jgi:ethanolamine ammonia-lyase small subunit